MFDLRSLLDFRESWNRRIWPDNSTNRFYEKIAGGAAPNRKPRARLPTRSNNLLESSFATCFYPKSRVFFKIRLSMNKLSRRRRNVDRFLFFFLSRSNLTYILNPNNDSNSKRNTLRVIYHLLNSSSQQAFPISSVPF